ncbi:calcium-binding protein [Streptomyces sp. NK08204]|uniref:calcium-binding protein n=1 Tax=Streptomyces sp. NK08204 TaxID=2873260 RepID=UPI001CED544B|nr:calcium-binding protein [Streptomyces sp. NK08204]
MRIRASVAAVTVASGALALSALAAPAAMADGGDGDTAITKVVVGSFNKVEVGTYYDKTISVSVTASDDSGIKSMDEFVLTGPNGGFLMTSQPTCTAVSATTSTCKASVTVDPKVDYLMNNTAGTWYVGVWADANDGNYSWKDKAGSFLFQRSSKVTSNASPEPVAKGKTITVTGSLTRANWETLKYGAYGSQYVKLQYLKKGASTWTTLKTVTSSSTGYVKATTTATYDGYYRFSFAGTTTTAAARSISDFVDVQ